MQKDERFLSRKITRFNYWELEIAKPTPRHLLRPTVQRLADYPNIQWNDRSGRGALPRHIQQTFLLLLNASPAVWNEKVRPWLHKEIADIPHRPFFALKYYVEEDKEWRSNVTAQGVLKQLSPPQQAAILRHHRTTWPERSKRPARLTRTWEKLLKDIAQDQESFLKYCDGGQDARAMSDSTKRRIARIYSKQAIKLLGGGTPIEEHRRKMYPDCYPGEPSNSTLLDGKGRLPCNSVFPINWNDQATREARREAKKHSLHWFNHALRNLREYCNRRPPIPWSPDCAKTCRRIQQKLTTLK